MQETQNNKRPNSFFWENPLCQKIYENEFGSLAVELITEMLQFYKMDYTLSVFPHEANLKEEVTREKLSKKLSLNPDNDKNAPLLISMIKAFFSGTANSNFEKKPNQEVRVEERKEDISKGLTKEARDGTKEQQINKEIKKEALREPEPPAKKELPVNLPSKKEPEIPKEIPKEAPKEIPPKKNEQKEAPPQAQGKAPQQLPPVNTTNKQAQRNFDNFQTNEPKGKKKNRW